MSSRLAIQFRELASLSLPVIFAELGWVFMGVVDTIMVGPLGPSAIGAVSIGSVAFEAIGLFGIGLLLGLDTLVSQAYGAGRLKDCDRALWHGLYLALLVTPILILSLQVVPPALRAFGVHAGVLELAIPYSRALAWSLPPLLVYSAFRRYLQGQGIVAVVTFALLSANVLNFLGNKWLIPSFGVEGSAFATVGARVYMALVLVMFAGWRNFGLLRPILPEWQQMRVLLRLGLPAATQMLLEIGVFGAATAIAGKLGPQPLAAHHIVLNLASTTFMVPLGISSAGAVLVGQAMGRGDPVSAKRAGWLALAFGIGFMGLACLCFLAAPGMLLGIFTRNAEVLAIAVPLLFVAAVFQLFDGIQVVATGILRGAGNTRTPMVANFMGHWLLGLPCGYALCFYFGFGVVGLWVGLSIGLIVVGCALLRAWHRASLG